jgi:hypothetical protein
LVPIINPPFADNSPHLKPSGGLCSIKWNIKKSAAPRGRDGAGAGPRPELKRDGRCAPRSP